jgi:glycosyltransferase involved in cell wall biosynthesis
MTYPFEVSVVICTFNPNKDRLNRTILALNAQTLSPDVFEIVIVDNASTFQIEIDYPSPNLRFVRELRPGLTFARLRGVNETRSPIVVFVDDDNILNVDYLEILLGRFADDQALGAIGGRITPIWEIGTPPAWIDEFRDLLALRDHGELFLRAVATDPLSYPLFAPVGAGMALRRDALASWIAAVTAGDGTADRTGNSLSSGGDNDIVLHVLRSGWAVAYEPRISLGHIIPPERLSREYLGRLAQDIMISWVGTLERHGIYPWRPSAAWLTELRLIRVYFVRKPWLSNSHYVRWRQSRGLILGRARMRTVSLDGGE